VSQGYMVSRDHRINPYDIPVLPWWATYQSTLLQFSHILLTPLVNLVYFHFCYFILIAS
jgi:hypothetical protein